jgi:hypothetical protein
MVFLLLMTSPRMLASSEELRDIYCVADLAFVGRITKIEMRNYADWRSQPGAGALAASVEIVPLI